MAATIVDVYQADTGKWYVRVRLGHSVQEFKFADKPDEAALAFAVGEMYRQHQPIDNQFLTREIKNVRQE